MEKIKDFVRFVMRSEDIWSLLSLLAQSGVGGFMIALYVKLQLLESPLKELLLVLAIFTFLLFFVALAKLILAFRSKRKLAVLYEGRGQAPHYIEDMKRAKEVWVAWQTAGIAGTTGELGRDQLGTRITRLTLIDPDGHYLPIHAPQIPNVKTDDIRSDIKLSTKRLLGEGVREIRYVDGLVLNMMICNPRDNKKGWARIETWSTFLEAGSRPIFYVNAKRHPSLFKWIRDSYEQTWEKIAVPIPSIADKEGSQN